MVMKFNRAFLALDLGAQTGWAVTLRDGDVRYGCEKMNSKKGNGDKWRLFRAFLNATYEKYGFTAIYYEDVKRHIGVLAAHAYGGFKAHLEHWAETHAVEMIPVGVGTIKKSFTGKGNALKIDMIKQAQSKGYSTDNDNTADAIAIAEYAHRLENEDIKEVG